MSRSYAEELVARWEKADPRDRWRYGLAPKPSHKIRNAPLQPNGPTLPIVDDFSIIRPDHVLHELNPNQWTVEEQEHHLRETFEQACRGYPDMMEPYVVRISDLTDLAEIESFMRSALAETIRARFPLKHQEQAAE